MLNFLRFLVSKELWLSLLIMLLLTLGIVWGTFALLKVYTHHGESITVPDLRDLTLDQVQTYLETKNLRYFVMDSTYVKEKEPNVVIDQSPRPGTKVKESRRLYLTINAVKPPLVKVPNIIDNSLRYARTQLEMLGLDVGELKYREDMAKNAVLEIRIAGNIIEAGLEVEKGTKIDLILGNGYGSTSVKVPALTGLTFREAQLTLLANDLNVGQVFANEDVVNKAYALVYKQEPGLGADSSANITIGEPIDLYLERNPDPTVIDEEIIVEEGLVPVTENPTATTAPAAIDSKKEAEKQLEPKENDPIEEEKEILGMPKVRVSDKLRDALRKQAAAKKKREENIPPPPKRPKPRPTPPAPASAAPPVPPTAPPPAPAETAAPKPQPSVAPLKPAAAIQPNKPKPKPPAPADAPPKEEAPPVVNPLKKKP